jgi:hypothetical protein
MAHGVITKMSYWDTGQIRPDGSAVESKDLPFRWSDVLGTTTFEQFEVGKMVDFKMGRDAHFGSAKATNVRPGTS